MRQRWRERLGKGALVPHSFLGLVLAVPKPSLPARPQWNPNAPFISAAPQLYPREMLCGSQSKISS